MATATPTSPIEPAYSSHALTRMAQRAIPPVIVETLLAVGRRDHDHLGAIRVHLHDKKRLARFAGLMHHFGKKAGEAERYSDVYAVIDAKMSTLAQPYVITVGRMDRRARVK